MHVAAFFLMSRITSLSLHGFVVDSVVVATENSTTMASCHSAPPPSVMITDGSSLYRLPAVAVLVYPLYMGRRGAANHSGSLISQPWMSSPRVTNPGEAGEYMPNTASPQSPNHDVEEPLLYPPGVPPQRPALLLRQKENHLLHRNQKEYAVQTLFTYLSDISFLCSRLCLWLHHHHHNHTTNPHHRCLI